MSWGFAEGIIFAAIMTEIEQELIKEEKSLAMYQNCREKFSAKIKVLSGLIGNVTKKAASVYYPSEILKGIEYLPLFCISKALHVQTGATDEQTKLIKAYFDTFDFSFTQNRFVDAVSLGSNVGDFNEFMMLNKYQIGTFWLELFRAFYKGGTQRDFQDVIDGVTGAIRMACVLGDLPLDIAKDLCSEFIDSANYHIKNVKTLAVNEVDWLGILSISERKAKIKNSYYSLIEKTDLKDEMGEEDMKDLFDMLLVHSVCDIIAMVKRPNKERMQMLKEAIQRVDVTCVIPPEEYIKEVALQQDFGKAYSQMFSFGPGRGHFWRMLFAMGVQADGEEDPIEFVKGLISILIHIEQYLVEKFGSLGTEQITKRYSAYIISSVIKEIQ